APAIATATTRGRSPRRNRLPRATPISDDAAAPAYNRHAVASGPTHMPAQATTGVVAPNAIAAAIAIMTPRRMTYCNHVPDEAPCRLRDLVRYFLYLGTFGFGGPIALAGYMQRDLVERRRWIAPEEYKQG